MSAALFLLLGDMLPIFSPADCFAGLHGSEMLDGLMNCIYEPTILLVNLKPTILFSAC